MGGHLERYRGLPNTIQFDILILMQRERDQQMSNLFEQNRNYVLGDPELDLIGDREKLAQWRHKNTGPAYYRLGRKIVYRGTDLNAWADANRVDPALGGRD